MIVHCESRIVHYIRLRWQTLRWPGEHPRPPSPGPPPPIEIGGCYGKCAGAHWQAMGRARPPWRAFNRRRAWGVGPHCTMLARCRFG